MFLIWKQCSWFGRNVPSFGNNVPDFEKNVPHFGNNVPYFGRNVLNLNWIFLISKKVPISNNENPN